MQKIRKIPCQLHCSVYFEPRKRPVFETIEKMCESRLSTIKMTSGTSGRTLLLYGGLQFELAGLNPGPPAPVPPEVRNARIGVEFRPSEFEPIEVSFLPARNQATRLENLVRALAHVGAELSALPEAKAVQWNRTKGFCNIGVFRGAIRKWPKRDLLPPEGLISICRMPDGGVQTDGLSLFSGQEIRLEPELAEPLYESRHNALNIAQKFAREGALSMPMRIKNPLGGYLRIEPSANKRFIRVWVDETRRPFGMPGEHRAHSVKAIANQKWGLTRWVPPSLL